MKLFDKNKIKKAIGFPEPAITIIEESETGEKPISHKAKRDFSDFIKFINIAILTIFLLTVSICLIVMKRPTVSYVENRTLAKFPEFSFASYFSGEYTDQISQFYNDTVPNRDKFKGFTSNIVNCFGFGGNNDNGAQFYGNAIEIESSSVSETNAEATTNSGVVTTTAPATTTKQVGNEIEEGVISNGILVINNRGLMLYGGSYQVGRNYASYLNTYKLELGKDVNIYSMVVPTSVAYYLPEKYKKYSASQLDNINNINSYLKDVKAVDVYSVLEQHKDEAIYSRTDHHWQPLGAYYAAQTFAVDANVPFADLSTYEKVVETDYVGTLYSFTQNASLKNNPEDFIYYKPSNSYTTTYYNTAFQNPSVRSLFVKAYGSNRYCSFLGSDQLIARLETDVKNGRRLVIIKDSYGNALVPFLTNSFEEIYVVDMRYFDLNAIKFIKEKNITDVLFASCSFSATGANAKCIEKIRTK
ncbi:MAG: hypothetical protein K5917_05845 [Clostridiales bacterium]|nr:hypothetical protein [Clostridiales bacterium]